MHCYREQRNKSSSQITAGSGFAHRLIPAVHRLQRRQCTPVLRRRCIHLAREENTEGSSVPRFYLHNRTRSPVTEPNRRRVGSGSVSRPVQFQVRFDLTQSVQEKPISPAAAVRPDVSRKVKPASRVDQIDGQNSISVLRAIRTPNCTPFLPGDSC